MSRICTTVGEEPILREAPAVENGILQGRRVRAIQALIARYFGVGRDIYKGQVILFKQAIYYYQVIFRWSVVGLCFLVGPRRDMEHLEIWWSPYTGPK